MILQPVAGAGRGAAHIVDANCQISDAVKDVVHVSGDEVGGIYTVTKVDIAATDAVEAIGIGVITEKLTSTTCRVQLNGPLVGVYTGLTPGRRLFVGNLGQLVEAPPLPSSGASLIQKMGYALSSSAVMLAPAEPSRLIA